MTKKSRNETRANNVDPCSSYETKQPKELNRLLIKGQIMGWGSIHGKTTVLCRERFDSWFKDATATEYEARVKSRVDDTQSFGFRMFSGAARPGTGIVAVREGRQVGPGGALGLFLEKTSNTRSREDREVPTTWFLAAAHVLTNFTDSRPDIFRSRQGLTARSARRKLGTVRDVAGVVPLNLKKPRARKWNVSDAGLVELDAVDWKQKTTCFGEVGLPKDAEVESIVRKCGPEEPHSTWGEIVGTDWRVRIIHGGKTYLFKNQILVQTKFDEANGWVQRPPFALPGDSGSVVVDAQDGRPIGMLMAGSVRDNFYFLNPIMSLRDYWMGQGLAQPAAKPIAKAPAGFSSAIPDVAARFPKGEDFAGARSGRFRGTDGR